MQCVCTLYDYMIEVSLCEKLPAPTEDIINESPVCLSRRLCNQALFGLNGWRGAFDWGLRETVMACTMMNLVNRCSVCV